jgi:hypothetical protein
VAAAVLVGKVSLGSECLISGWSEPVPLRAENGELVGTLVAGAPLRVTLDEKDLSAVEVHHGGLRLDVFVQRDELGLSVDRDLSFGFYVAPRGARVVAGALREDAQVALLPPPRPDVRTLVPFAGIDVSCDALRLWRPTTKVIVKGEALAKPLAVSAKPGQPTALVLEAGVRVEVTPGRPWSRVKAHFEDGARIDGWTRDRPEYDGLSGDGEGGLTCRALPEPRVLTQCARPLPFFLESGAHTLVLGTLDVGTRFQTGPVTSAFAPLTHLEADEPVSWPDGTRLLVRVTDLAACTQVPVEPSRPVEL